MNYPKWIRAGNGMKVLESCSEATITNNNKIVQFLKKIFSGGKTLLFEIDFKKAAHRYCFGHSVYVLCVFPEAGIQRNQVSITKCKISFNGA